MAVIGVEVVLVSIEFNLDGVVTQAKSARRVLRLTDCTIDKHDNALLLAWELGAERLHCQLPDLHFGCAMLLGGDA